MDHVLPVSRAHMKRDFDPNCLINLLPACHSCNNYKATFDLEGFRRELAEQVDRARRQSVNFRFAERYGLIQVLGGKVEFYFERHARESGAAHD